jgi:hypothetical protein
LKRRLQAAHQAIGGIADLAYSVSDLAYGVAYSISQGADGIPCLPQGLAGLVDNSRKLVGGLSGVTCLGVGGGGQSYSDGANREWRENTCDLGHSISLKTRW